MKQASSTGALDNRRAPPLIIIARGNEVRHFTLNPRLTLISGSVLAAFAVAFLSATSYLVLRDDLITAAAARQARVQQAYEDRIAALREQVDRIASQQMLEQQSMQRRVAELIERQERLTRRESRLGSVLKRAERLDNDQPALASPSPGLEIRAGLDQDGLGPDYSTVTATAYAPARPAMSVPFPIRSTHRVFDAKETDELVLALDRSLHDLESDQLTRIGSLAEEAYQTAEAIAEALDAAGIEIAAGYGETDVGGPLIAAPDGLSFEEKVRELDETLSRLDELKETVRRLPVTHPLPGAAVTSSFGVRRDPILKRAAYHSGVDFRGASGSPVRAGGAGVVVSASWQGGYGRMVEIDHGDGLVTRYAHLSKIAVKEGAQVTTGTIVGMVGSSGRSTGPHLHYEVRRNGKAVNPLKFISAGRKIERFL